MAHQLIALQECFPFKHNRNTNWVVGNLLFLLTWSMPFPAQKPSKDIRPRHTMRQIAATRRCDKSPRLHCCCDKSLALSLSLRYVARIQTSLNSCNRSQRQNSVTAIMIFTCHTKRFVAATCRGDVSQRFVASCVSAQVWKLEKNRLSWNLRPAFNWLNPEKRLNIYK